MRVSSTVALSIGFLVLIFTGVLLYISPYSNFTSSLHVWSALIVLACVGLHVRNNWKPYKGYLKKRMGKKVFALVWLGLLVVSLGLFLEKAPFTTLSDVGKQLRRSASIDQNQFTSINLTNSERGKSLVLFAKSGKYYESDKQSIFGGLITYTTTPQMAVWLETMEGKYIRTLYVTGKLASSGFSDPEFTGEVVRRPEALPHWMHQRNVLAKDGLLVPDPATTEFDGFTAATPVGSHQLRLSASEFEEYKIKVEVNRTYDFNEYYSKDRFPDDSVYSGSGSSGQPSLIYEAVINSVEKGDTLLRLIGHGHYSGRTGEIYPDVLKISTAKALFDFFVVSVQ